MPNIKSAKKRVLIAKVNNERNKADKSALKTTVKKANASIEANADNKAELVKAAGVALNKAAGKGLIHKNTASRKVSRMAKKANTAESAK